MLGRGNPRDNQRDNPRFSRHPSPRDAKSVGRLEYAAATSIGKLRSNNEDAYLLDEPLFAVADGMGGHAAGEIAANLAITTLKESPDDPTQPDILRQMVMAANVEVLEAPVKGYGRAGMGTTLTAAAIQNDRLLIAQVGDSRAYLLHDGQLRRLTRDHSMVQELLNAGEISEDEVREHPQRGIITRVLGYEYETQPDIYELRLEAGDRLLLCSDGLHGMIDDSEIAAMLLTCHPAQQCADTLVQAANAAGGLDNTTVVVIDIHALAAPANPGRRGCAWASSASCWPSPCWSADRWPASGGMPRTLPT
ncbi:MAG: Stp1/IreP family PP2C-type Ser/Thr phosphatase [Coriobacteriia bacterium]|nr:Stp1/IreP family PP2C-type Ser/Thr phosphatase [Coriobacteriia bacterium]